MTLEDIFLELTGAEKRGSGRRKAARQASEEAKA